MPSYRKVGGLHWISIGRIRIAFCITKPKPMLTQHYPIGPYETAMQKEHELIAQRNAEAQRINVQMFW